MPFARLLAAAAALLTLDACLQPVELLEPNEDEFVEGNTGPTGGGGSQDRTAPTVTITSPMNNAILMPGMLVFSGSATDDLGVASVAVQVGSMGTFVSASGTTSWTGTVDATAFPLGNYTVTVRATDGTGNVGTATITITLSALPVATLSDLPDVVTNDTDLNVTVGGTGVDQYKYRLDGAAFGTARAVTLPIIANALGEGMHTLDVIGIDSIGIEQTTATSYAWTIDTTAPVATLSGGPSALTNVTSVSITIGGAGVVSYLFNYDSGGFSTTPTPVATVFTRIGLADGGHSLQVVGIDAAGNQQALPTSLSWTVDTIPPVATLSNIPPSLSGATTLNATVGGLGVVSYQYRFTSSPPFADSTSGWSADIPVATPITRSGLVSGDYRVEVVGRDAANNLQTFASAAFGQWQVDTSIPNAEFISGLPAVGPTGTPITSYDVVVGGTGIVAYNAKLDGGAYGPTAGTGVHATGSNLLDGVHTLSVIGTNNVGAVQPQASATSFTWTINTPPQIGTPPASQTVNEGQMFTFPNVNATKANGGPGTLSYQWQKNTVDIPGETSASLTFNMVAGTDVGSYRVVVTHAVNGTTTTTTSSAAVLSVTCPAGKTDDDANPMTACLACGAGHFVPQSSTGACSIYECAAGHADLDSDAATACGTCSAGTFSAAAASSCTSCSPGTFSGSAAGSCSNCGAGTFAPTGAASCTTCGAGTFSVTASGSCTDCVGGTFAPSGSAACTSCGAGTFSGNRAPSCSSCTAGTFSTMGSASCTSCDAGTFSGPAAPACTSCGAGTFAPTGSSSCTTCGAGTFSVPASASCTDCLAGTFAPSGAAACTSCGAGKFSGSAAATCSDCSAGTFSTMGSASCTSCSAGTFSGPAAAACTNCGAGTFAPTGSSSCTTCGAGTFSVPASASCTGCLAGTFAPTGAATCNTCGAGTFSGNAAATCSDCGAGTFSIPGSASCTSCSPGTFSGNAAPACTDCAAGTFAPTGASACVSCAAGTFSGNAAPACIACNSGEFAPTGSSGCTACVSGTADLDVNPATACAQCGGGTFAPTGTTGCTSCGAGTFAGPGAASCTPCNAGKFSSAAATVCSNCSAGTYAPTGSASCTSCGAGTADLDADPSTVCTQCSAGRFSAGGGTTCSNCGAGTFSSAGASSCTSCSPGTFSLSTAASCTSCSPGTFAPTGASSCTSCGAGTFSGLGAGSCSGCAAGTFAPTGSGSCPSCAAGTSDDDSNAATACETCVAGQFAATGSTGTCASHACPATVLNPFIDLDKNPATACVATPALDYDGSDDCVTIGPLFASGTRTTVTVEAWIQHDNAINVGDFGQFIFSHRANLRDITLSYYPSLTRLDWAFGGPGGFHSIQHTVDLGDNAWHHVAGTYDGTTMRLWIDGAEVASLLVSDTMDFGSSIWDTLGCNGTDSQFYAARLRSIRVSSTPRYGATFTPEWLPSVDANTEALWAFDAGTGTTVGDSGPSGNTGTIAGGATWITVP